MFFYFYFFVILENLIYIYFLVGFILPLLLAFSILFLGFLILIVLFVFVVCVCRKRETLLLRDGKLFKQRPMPHASGISCEMMDYD